MADANRVVDAMSKQLAEAIKQTIIAQVEVEELREELAIEKAKLKEKQ